MTALLVILFCGYFVLGSLDYGVALVATGRAELDRISPFFLGNEVWLVAAVGLLFGAFPLNEGELLGAYRVPVALALVGVVMVTAAFGLRIFSPSRAAFSHASSGASSGRITVMAAESRRVTGHNRDLAAPGDAGSGVAVGSGVGPLDGVAKIGGTLAALGWGATLGAVWHGGSFGISLPVIVGALGMLALVGLHGWAYLRRRWLVLGATTAVLIGSVAAAGSTVTWHPASSAALDVLAPVAYALVPFLIVIQGATWWMFRTRHLSEPRSQAPTTSA